jgi:large subunit ribosomal protein L25
MTEMTLTANLREGTGKSVTRKLRRAGLVPGVVYGVEAPVNIQCDAHEAGILVHALHGSERLISLKLEGGPEGSKKEKRVLLKEVQHTPVGQKLLHIDLFEVDVSQEVQVSVEVIPEGRPEGEKMGGILQQVTREVIVQCLPTIIPEYLGVDVSTLEIGQSLHLDAVRMPEGLTPITNLEETIFVMAAPRVEEEEVEEVEGEEGLEDGEEKDATDADEASASEENAEE